MLLVEFLKLLNSIKATGCLCTVSMILNTLVSLLYFDWHSFNCWNNALGFVLNVLCISFHVAVQ